MRLYDLTKDWKQYETSPPSIRPSSQELKILFWSEASTRYCHSTPPSRPVSSLHVPVSLPAAPSSLGPARSPARRTVAPSIIDSSYNFKAEVEVPQGSAEGMTATQGGRFGGYGFYVLKGKPVFLQNLRDLKRVRWDGPNALAPGKYTLEFGFKYDGLGVGPSPSTT
jgi:hypothetical protein